MTKLPVKAATAKVPANRASIPASAASPTSGWSAKRHMTMGIIAMSVLLGGFGTWAATANISGAIISQGRVAVEDNRQVVQHPDGGVVGEIFVREGDRVDENQILLRLDDTLLRAEAEIVEDQLRALEARSARLEAERDNQDIFEFDQDLLDAAAEDEEIADAVTGQRNLFDARAESIATQTEQLSRRKDQISSQIQGIESQREALETQLAFIEEELTAQQTLLAQGLTQAPRVLSLQREQARLLGQVGELQAAVAESEGRITEIDLQIVRLSTDRREQAIAELRDLRVREVELGERLRALEEQLSRLEITAPVAGVVYDLQVFSERSVIRPADPVLYLVPQDRPLVIRSQVEPIHIDQVFPGQPVTLRLPAFDARTTPELAGRVVRVSPDAFIDEATRRAYYSADILPEDGEIDRLSQPLLPGMPVEAYLRTEDRTPIAYLVKPLTDYFNRAFRE
ncbi:Type I secretion system membrane fusion protein PrsE [Jannaschia aquimarina]|uniref:Membrane fusion protein (MFP) family protein n=2 Tax=Jannaschia aquimarina TaxID=935700 RepID=A0A0D1ECI5_9RHOB|nr:Type I secretion system membrane fusion protein PrsE [Jannaschia aquimarina]SNT22417.1 HlyD family secretion protein [Jannaschia aquimarina]